MKDVDFFTPGARLALEQWRQAVWAMEAAVSWNYRIGLVSVSSGRFIDEEVLSNV